MRTLVFTLLLSSTLAWADRLPLSCWSSEARYTSRLNYSVYARQDEDYVHVYVHRNSAKVGLTWVADMGREEYDRMLQSGWLIVPMKRLRRGVRIESNTLLRLEFASSSGARGSISYPGLENLIIEHVDCSPEK